MSGGLESTPVEKRSWLNIHKRLYDWVLKWAETPYGLLAHLRTQSYKRL